MAKAHDDEVAGNHSHEENLGDTATERLNRSNSFARAVEQVVLEYEKTIQSLEQSLTSTRATLSNTETNLLEKETKCAYIETINAQLQARLQKVMDREASTESYLHDLEAKLDGHTSGEEKNATIVLELRKEIARIRENEAACEDYISTLEERLAEADQDQELMQREIDRLEQVIERQRSLGKLDNLLYELDHIQQDGKQSDTQSEHSNGIGHRRTFSERSTKSHASRPSLGVRGVLPEVAEGTEEDASEHAHPEEITDDTQTPENPAEATEKKPSSTDYPPQSPAQNQFVADKLENVTEELVALRVEHESTLNEYDLLQSKYEEALRTLSELRDQVDEARHPNRQRDSVLSITSPDQTRPSSFLSDGRSSDIRDGTHLSRSLSSELSSAMDSPTTIDSPEIDIPKSSESRETLVAETVSNDHSEALTAELERLKALADEKQAAEKELAEKYAQLEEKHQETLDMVEELKTEVAKAKHMEPPSPRTATPVIRRKSSQNVLVIDRAHRSFATLRNLAAENFEEQPDIMQNFNLNLNTAMHELHVRSERIQELEAEIATAKKEMETKMTIISGLTRERSSLKSSPMDISMVGNLREQLERNEQQLQEMKEAHKTREKELVAELESLRASVNAASEAQSTPAAQTQDSSSQGNDQHIAQEEKIAHLEAELSSWESKHQATLDAMQAAEEQMKKTISDLEAEVAAVNAKLSDSREQGKTDEESKAAEMKHQDLVTALRSEIDEYKALVDSNATKVAELEEAHTLAKEQLKEVSKARDIASAESRGYRELVELLENQIAEHEKSLKAHEESLAQLQDEHAKEIDAIRTSSKEEYDAQINELMLEHAENVKLLESDVAEARDELMKVATQVAFALGLEVSVDKISERIEDLIADQKALAIEQQKSAELENHIDELSAINNTIMRDLEAVKSSLNDMLHPDGEGMKSPYPSVVEQLAAVKKKINDLENKNKKHSRLVEELEDQLQTNYDQAQITNNRLSTLQTERNTQLEEANAARLKAQAELEAVREEMAALQARVEEYTTNVDGPKRTSSTSSQVRKTGSVASLPSPPPAIPLPPLPPTGATSPTQATPTGGRPTSHDLALAQIREDQEARIQSIERHLKAERQLTSTLEEALTDLEGQSKKIKADCDAWRKRAQELETEVKELKERPQQDNRWRDSLHQIEEERKKRQDAERARTHLEERMNAINNKKKKKGSLNCF
ncbi:hypothetical protein K449DRAFT_221524 [Hypoxylon sp. EC38]|nr:hypothetical protein K449DRAFT_221524 [Hypoxylon sp. EC38]